MRCSSLTVKGGTPAAGSDGSSSELGKAQSLPWLRDFVRVPEGHTYYEHGVR
jgi:hypothetical protein